MYKLVSHYLAHGLSRKFHEFFGLNSCMQLSIIWLVLLLLTIHVASADVSNSNETPPTILVWGDSLSAAYGIPQDQGWVSLLQKKLGEQAKVINASISGETTKGGLTRLPNALDKYQPDILLLELGANDGLRGLPVKTMKSNLQQMIERAQEHKVKVVLLGIKMPPNYGITYTRQFDAAFADLAEAYDLPYVPFILDGVATDFDLMQADGLHPTAEAQAKVLENILPVVETTLQAINPATVIYQSHSQPAKLINHVLTANTNSSHPEMHAYCAHRIRKIGFSEEFVGNLHCPSFRRMLESRCTERRSTL